MVKKRRFHYSIILCAGRHRTIYILPSVRPFPVIMALGTMTELVNPAEEKEAHNTSEVGIKQWKSFRFVRRKSFSFPLGSSSELPGTESGWVVVRNFSETGRVDEDDGRKSGQRNGLDCGEKER